MGKVGGITEYACLAVGGDDTDWTPACRRQGFTRIYLLAPPVSLRLPSPFSQLSVFPTF